MSRRRRRDFGGERRSGGLVGHDGGADETAYSTLAQIERAASAAWDLHGSSIAGRADIGRDTPRDRRRALFHRSYAAVYAVDGAPASCSGGTIRKFGSTPSKIAICASGSIAACLCKRPDLRRHSRRRLIALDAKTGSLLWSVETATAQSFQTSPARRVYSTPRYHRQRRRRLQARAATSLPTTRRRVSRRGVSTSYRHSDEIAATGHGTCSGDWSGDFLKKARRGGPWTASLRPTTESAYVGPATLSL